VNATAKQQLRRNVLNDPYSNPTKTYSVPATTNEDGTINIPAQPVYLIDPATEPIGAGSNVMVSTKPGGAKSVTGFTLGLPAGGQGLNVPAGKFWVIQSCIADVVCTATVGNRTIGGRVVVGGTTFYWFGATSAATTAGQTCGYDIGFGNVGAPSTTVRRNIANTANTNIQVREMCPITILRAGDSVTIDDYADIDVADQITMRLWYSEYDV